jgi:hypothetical protein
MIARIGATKKKSTSVEITMVDPQAIRWLGVRTEEKLLNSSFLP